MNFPVPFSVNDGLDITRPDYLRSRISLISLFLASGGLLFFSIYNFWLGDLLASALEVFIMLVAIALLFDYYLNHHLERMCNGLVITMFALFVPLTLMSQGEDFSLAWTIFFPMIAILTKGQRVGLIATVLFYTVIIAAAYNGIGEWQSGHWNARSFTRFLFASLMLTTLVYLIEVVKEYIYRKIHELIEREQRHVKLLESLSNVDPLTGLYNRRHLQENFPNQFNTAKRHSLVFGFLILDIDDFKSINDRFGHQEGDNVLKKVASIFLAHMRRGSDAAYRLGGEEFGGLVVAETPEQIVLQAQRLKEAISLEAIPHATTGVLGVSIGVDIVENFEGESFDTIYARADKALYRAKELGKDRIIVYQRDT